LDPSGAQVLFAHLFAQERTDGVADQAVEHPPRLLRVDERLIDLARRGERAVNRVARDLVEFNPADRLALEGAIERGGKVPGNRFPLAVRIGGEKDLGRILRVGLELCDDLFLLGRNHIMGTKIMFNVDAHLAFRQIANMPDRRAYSKAAPQKAPHRPRLGRRFDDDKAGAGTGWGGRFGDWVIVGAKRRPSRRSRGLATRVLCGG
jgi:hypothetical protein